MTLLKRISLITTTKTIQNSWSSWIWKQQESIYLNSLKINENDPIIIFWDLYILHTWTLFDVTLQWLNKILFFSNQERVLDLEHDNDTNYQADLQ
jgi:hypothetical protein